MPPNGAVIFGLLTSGRFLRATSSVSRHSGHYVDLRALGSKKRIFGALAWSGGIVLPLALFMGLVWIGIVGARRPRSPRMPKARAPRAALYVADPCCVWSSSHSRSRPIPDFPAVAVRFVGGLTAPTLAKKLLVLTLSLIETILQAIDRARTALIAAGIITRRQSWRNLRHGWILVQTVWLTG